VQFLSHCRSQMGSVRSAKLLTLHTSYRKLLQGCSSRSCRTLTRHTSIHKYHSRTSSYHASKSLQTTHNDPAVAAACVVEGGQLGAG
jgi:hypothetical protein